MKQEQVMRRKREKEEEIQKNMNEKNSMLQEREKKLHETKIRYESQTEGFKQQLSEKLGKIDERVINYIIIIIYLFIKQILRTKSEHYRSLLNKFDSLSVKREDKYENVVRIEKIQEYEREKKLEVIHDRMKRIEEMK